MNKKIKILVVSNTPWANDNSFGNSFSNIFYGMKNVEFANIYCRYGQINSELVSRSFQITEKSLIRNLLNREIPSGIETTGSRTKNAFELNSIEESTFNTIRKQRFILYFWIRNLIWKIGRWKSKELCQFIDDFQPDMMFQPVYHSLYLNEIVLFCQKHRPMPMSGYTSDDIYSLRQLSFSPLYWIDRLMIRRYVKKVVDKCKCLYVISELQKKDYQHFFNKECKVLTKGANFNGSVKVKEKYNKPLKLVFTGNIGAGRWHMLAEIAKALKIINKDEIKAQMFIYSTTPLAKEMNKALNVDNCSYFLGGVPSEEVNKLQHDADILLHAEAFSLKYRLLVRYSLSTKIVDYLASGRPIFAVGHESMASIKHLLENDAAVVAQNRIEIFEKLQYMVNNQNELNSYARNAWETGRKFHQIDKFQTMLRNDFETLLKGTR